MNIHPIFVHFPVALFTLYSLTELIRFRKLTVNSNWILIKAFLVIVGTLSAYATILTGEAAEHLYLQSHPGMENVVETHQFFALSTTVIFTIISVTYLVRLIKTSGYEQKVKNIFGLKQLWQPITLVSGFLGRPAVAIVFALIGLCAITITGALGGSLVYGPDVDPFVSFIYRLLVGSGN